MIALSKAVEFFHCGLEPRQLTSYEPMNSRYASTRPSLMVPYLMALMIRFALVYWCLAVALCPRSSDEHTFTLSNHYQGEKTRASKDCQLEASN